VTELKIKILYSASERADCCLGVSGEPFEGNHKKWFGKFKLDWVMNTINGNKCNSKEWLPYGEAASVGD